MSRPRTNKKRFKYEKGIAIYPTTSDDVALAHTRSCQLGIPRGSYMYGMGRMTGFLGEIAVNAYLPRSHYVGDEEFTHDIIYKKKRVEVKSKTCGGCPEPEYSAFVNGKQLMKPDNDAYFFTRVRRDMQRVYICGWLPTRTLFKKAQFVPKGFTDDKGYTFKASGYHIEISELNPPKAFK